jgi:tetratricopeptide (TPR) repeat protein
MTKNTPCIVLFLSFAWVNIAGAQQATVDDDINLLDQVVPVADDDATDVVEIADSSDDEVSEEVLLATFARYRLLLAEGAMDEADVTAKRIVEMAIRIYGPRSRETASALNNLGIVQHSNGQFDAAIQNFESAIEIVEVVEDRLHSGLVNPLKGLGAAQLAIGRPDEAKDTLVRAAHITHVNEGPHNIEQTEILESITEAQLRMGDLKEARRTLDRIHVLNVRFFEKDPLGLLPSLMKRATWQHRAGYFNDERTTYRRAIRIVESGNGKSHPMLIEPLRRMGESFYYVDLTASSQQPTGLITTGEMFFKRAARIANKIGYNDSFHQWTITNLALADYYNFLDNQNRSRKIYRRVWEALSEGEERIAFRDKLLGNPVVTRGESLPEFVEVDETSNDRNEILTGRIVVDYTVSRRGRVRNLQTEAIPPEFRTVQRMVHREIRQRIYRPRIVDGAPVEAEDQFFEHRFTYKQEDLDELIRRKEAATKAAKNR